MKKDRKKIIISIILGIYLSIVTSKVDIDSIYLMLIIFKAVTFSILIQKLISYIDKVFIPKKEQKLTKDDYLKWFLYIFLVMSVALYVYYPVNFTVDLKDQYGQVITGNYCDWHPIIHTLIFYKLPMLFITSKVMCSLFQMFFISIILLYFCHTLAKYGFNKKLITIILSLFILNTSFDLMAITPLKDVAFSYCIFLLTIFIMNIYLTNGKWMKKKTNFFFFFLASFGVAFFRHNGIVTFLLTMIFMIFIYKNIRKKSILIFLIILSLRFVFIPIIYEVNNINKTQATLSEMVCILLNQISYVYNNEGDITDSQLKTLSKMQDLKKLKTYYNPYNYNSYKFNSDFYLWQSYYINTHKKEFLTLWKDIVMKNKNMAFKSYFYSTYCIWHIGLDNDDNYKELYWISFSGNNINMEFQNNYFNYKKNINKLPFCIINITVASGLFLIILSLLYCLIKSKEKLKLLTTYIPVGSNIMLMLILLPGRDTRFVYSNILCAFPLVILMFLLNRNNIQKKVGEKCL